MRITYLVLALMLAAGAYGCTPIAANTASSNEATIQNQKNSGSILSGIIADPAAYENKTVTIEGTYMGWNYPCTTSGSQTRSDWILKTSDACIYVSGVNDPSLSPAQPKNEPIRVTGVVKLAGDKKPFIQGSEVIIIPSATKKTLLH